MTLFIVDGLAIGPLATPKPVAPQDEDSKNTSSSIPPPSMDDFWHFQKSFVIFAFGVLSLLSPVFSMTVFATEAEQSAAEISVAGDFEELSQTDQEAILKKLVHEAEEASEGTEQKNFFKTYVQKANLPKVMLGMLRWYETKKSDYPTFAADLSLLLLTSHSMEMLSGPIGAAWSQSQHLPIWVTSAIATVGGIISIPGLDPLCMLLGFTYVKSAKFRNGVGVTRIFLKNAVDKSGVGYVLTKGASVFFEKVPSHFPDSSAGEVAVEFYLADASKEDGPWLTLTVREETLPDTGKKVRYLHQITVDPKQRAIVRSEDRRMAKSMVGWNANLAVRDILNAQMLTPDEPIAHAFHILSDTRRDDVGLKTSVEMRSNYTVTFRAHSLPISYFKWVPCCSLLGGN